MAFKVKGKTTSIVNEVARFKKEEIEFLFELIKNSIIPGKHLGIAMDVVNKLKSQYKLYTSFVFNGKPIVYFCNWFMISIQYIFIDKYLLIM